METLENALESTGVAYLAMKNDPRAPLRGVLMPLLAKRLRLIEGMIRARAAQERAA